MNIYITGINGLLGTSLTRKLNNNHNISGCDISINKYSVIDITDRKAIQEDIKKNNPDIVIHCAAMINVDACQLDRKAAHAINVLGTKYIMDICNVLGKKLIYISSHAVYTGNNNRPNIETDDTFPVNYYAETKLQGEKMSALGNGLILRINHVGLSQSKYGFLNWVRNNLKENKEVPLYTNMYFSILYTGQVSSIISEILTLNLSGIYNIGSDCYTKYDLAKVFCEEFGYNENLLIPVEYKPENSDAIRPMNISVNVEKIERFIRMPDWEQGIKQLKKDFILYY